MKAADLRRRIKDIARDYLERSGKDTDREVCGT